MTQVYNPRQESSISLLTDCAHENYPQSLRSQNNIANSIETSDLAWESMETHYKQALTQFLGGCDLSGPSNDKCLQLSASRDDTALPSSVDLQTSSPMTHDSSSMSERFAMSNLEYLKPEVNVATLATSYTENQEEDISVSETLPTPCGEIFETKEKPQVPGLNFGFLARLKTEKFNRDIHIKDFDFKLERELSMLELAKARSTNYDSKCDSLYDAPGLTTFTFDDTSFHNEMESKFRMVNEMVEPEDCKCKSMCAIF